MEDYSKLSIEELEKEIQRLGEERALIKQRQAELHAVLDQKLTQRAADVLAGRIVSVRPANSEAKGK